MPTACKCPKIFIRRVAVLALQVIAHFFVVFTEYFHGRTPTQVRKTTPRLLSHGSPSAWAAATLAFENQGEILEPATLALVGLGMPAMGFTPLRRKQA